MGAYPKAAMNVIALGGLGDEVFRGADWEVTAWV